MWVSPGPVRVHRLSERHADWRRRPNRRGELPEIDFACCEPFRVLDEAGLQTVRSQVEASRPRSYANARSVSIRGVTELQQLFASSELERLASQIVATPLAVHPMALEHAHVNLEAPERAVVDDWHQDYVPFAFVAMIARSDASKSGRLCTDGFGDYALAPGEGLLLQGSHVAHKAEVAGGERITVIVSLVPASLEYWDTTYVNRHALPFSPDEPLYEQFRAYRCENVRRLQALLAGERDEQRRELWTQRLWREQHRLREAELPS